MKIFYFFIIISLNSYQALSKEYLCTTVSTDRIHKTELGQEFIHNSDGTIKYSKPIKFKKTFFGSSYTDMKVTLDDGYIQISYVDYRPEFFDLIVDKVVNETDRFLNIQFKPITFNTKNNFEKRSLKTTGTLYFNKINKKVIIDRNISKFRKYKITDSSVYYVHQWDTTIDKHKFDCAIYN